MLSFMKIYSIVMKLKYTEYFCPLLLTNSLYFKLRILSHAKELSNKFHPQHEMGKEQKQRVSVLYVGEKHGKSDVNSFFLDWESPRFVT